MNHRHKRMLFFLPFPCAVTLMRRIQGLMSLIISVTLDEKGDALNVTMWESERDDSRGRMYILIYYFLSKNFV